MLCGALDHAADFAAPVRDLIPAVSSSREKMRRLRRRQAEGRLLLRVEVDFDLVDRLVLDRWLGAEEVDDRAAVERAVERILGRYITAAR